MADTIKHSRHWMQFGLGTMFVLVTATTIGLGWIAYERRQSRHEMQIAKDLETSGADIEFGGLFDSAGFTNAAQHPKSSMWWRRALSGLVGPRVSRVKLDSNRSMRDLSLLASLGSLEALSLRHTTFWDISPLAGLKSLESINCEYALVSRLAPLAGLAQLRNLDLNYTQVTDLSAIARLESLQTLYLDKTGVRDISPLAKLKSLRRLDLNYTQVRDLSPLAGLTALQVLWLDGTDISDLTPLAELKELRELAVKDTDVSEAQVNTLHQALPNCKISSGVTPVPPVITIPTMPVRPGKASISTPARFRPSQPSPQ